MNTIVKWNTDKPKFEDVEGKSVVVKKSMELPPRMALRFYSEVTRSDYLDFYNFYSFVAYAILTDEVEYCEWKKNILGVYQGGCTSLCIDFNDWWKFCPHCGLPIKIVYETKPVLLDGIELEPKKYLDNSGFKSKYYYAIVTDDFYISGKICDTENEAITTWNSFVGRMGGEK